MTRTPPTLASLRAQLALAERRLGILDNQQAAATDERMQMRETVRRAEQRWRLDQKCRRLRWQIRRATEEGR